MFERALKADGAQMTARFFLARAAEQDGDLEGARSRYAAILAASPPEAPWAEAVRAAHGPPARRRGGGGRRRAARRRPPGPILGMVEGLAARLESGGGSLDEWPRLIRSYAVLGEPDRAAAALGKARAALAQRSSRRRAARRARPRLELKIAENRP